MRVRVRVGFLDELVRAANELDAWLGFRSRVRVKGKG